MHSAEVHSDAGAHVSSPVILGTCGPDKAGTSSPSLHLEWLVYENNTTLLRVTFPVRSLNLLLKRYMPTQRFFQSPLWTIVWRIVAVSGVLFG
jgi:hypothetical protein